MSRKAKFNDNYTEPELIGQVTDLVFTMLTDERIPLEVRKEYSKKVNDDGMEWMAIYSYDLIQSLKKK